MNRIKIVSRVLKILFPLYVVFRGTLPLGKTPDGFWVYNYGTYATLANVPLFVKLMVGLSIGLFLMAIITCYQLLNLCEKGIVFSARNVQLLGRIGCLTLGYGLLGVWGRVLFSAWRRWIGESPGSPWDLIPWGFCEFLISPCVIGGLFVAVISWIMDEGRKIQEEQELTV